MAVAWLDCASEHLGLPPRGGRRLGPQCSPVWQPLQRRWQWRWGRKRVGCSINAVGTQTFGALQRPSRKCASGGRPPWAGSRTQGSGDCGHQEGVGVWLHVGGSPGQPERTAVAAG